MCYTGSCQYEIATGLSGQGDCSVHGKDIPEDALCVRVERDMENAFRPTIEEFREYEKLMGAIDSHNDYNSHMFPGTSPVFKTQKEQDEFTDKFNEAVRVEIEKRKNNE